ncbi:tRNA threonylcarbamoyladenosine dehydratase [Cardiobacteriales bacterium ML27]|uniref:tRNA threonylcarbamoyladenosine dehydratase n=2 Tax=Ostreibacterium oceani TaxID=2654998 RepID=A0A6N7EX27_9GAMM|nr:tRNA threonylcarbamoyladenosine dehydratase [Ostreibacterium oceani]
MPTRHARTEILLGNDILPYLRQQHILVAGIGGVGGYVAENIARAGIGEITLLDRDVVAMSNINRQIVALESTFEQKKTDVMKARIADIDPSIRVHVIDEFMNTDNAETIVNSTAFDFIADCIDTIACKAQLVYAAQQANIPIISAMGAGNCYDATRVRVAKLHKTQGCPLAREMRRRLRALRASLKYPVVYTDETRSKPFVNHITSTNYNEKATNGTISYMPAMIGVMLAGEIMKTLIDSAKAPG